MSHDASFILYGATGYTGTLVARRARERGHRPLLAGRDAGKLERLGRELELEWVAVPLDRREALSALFERAPVVLNAAGPFVETAEAVLSAALDARAHYLDLSGEIDALEAVAHRHAHARERGVMALPAVGFDVVPSDCLAVYLARELGELTELSLGLFGLGAPSRGSLRTLVKEAGRRVRIRRDGAVRELASGSGERTFELPDGARAALPVSWGDVVTSHYSTGVPNVTVYFEATPGLRTALALSRAAHAFGAGAFGAALADAALPFAPERAIEPDARVRIVAEASGRRGRRRALLETPDVYAVTADAAVLAVERVLAGDAEPGFQTPGRLFGPDFVLELARVKRVDLPS